MRYLYFIQSKPNGSVKIGTAGNVKKRLNTLQTSSPFELVLLDAIQLKNANEVEKQLHYDLREKNLIGEWFDISEKEVGQIVQSLKTFGTNETIYKDKLKDFIIKKTALKHRVLCNMIQWSPQSFNQWINGVRNIPNEKATMLEAVLKDYGYKN